jgi:putative transcriptional regulator
LAICRKNKDSKKIIMSATLLPEQGRILISEPFLKDFYFKRSIVLLAEHNKDGTFGLVLNRTTDLKLSEILTSSEFKIPDEFDSKIYIGGPVKTDSLFFIHTRSDVISNSLKIMDGIYWGGNIDELVRLMYEKTLKPEEIRFYAGYSGWEPKQLDRELEEQSWVVARTTAAFLLKNSPEILWKKAVLNLGDGYKDWINYPIDPQMN